MVDILQEHDVGLVGQALQDMLTSPEVNKWIEHIPSRFELDIVHSSQGNSFENVIGKLVQLGQRAGLQPFDSKTLPARIWLAEQLEVYPDEPHAMFLRTIIASFLAYAGYGSTSMIEKLLIERLESLYKFARDPDFSQIFVDSSRLPKSLRAKGHHLVNPELYREQEFLLPWVHDIRGFANCEKIMKNEKYRNKLNSILTMIFTADYQDLPKDYGLVKFGSKYYVLGWAVHLPGFKSKPEGKEFAELLLTLQYMCRFAEVREGVWFQEMLDYLDTFKRDTGTYEFPSSWLPENEVGYWINGNRMQIDKREGNPKAIEYESTFHILQIKTMTSNKR
jgi:hypothetical protein